MRRAPSRTLRRALQAAGSEERLAQALEVSKQDLVHYLSGEKELPPEVFLKALDIVANVTASHSPNTPSAQRLILAPKEADTYQTTIAHVAQLVGGVQVLGDRLSIPPPELARWIAGDGKPDIQLFLRIVDVLIEEASKPR